MSEPIVVTPNLMPDPSGCMPGNRQELANFIPTGITVTFQGGEYALWNFGSSTPAVENQNRPWERTEASGIGIGNYIFYNGAWIRTGIPIGLVTFYSGTSSVFDGTGKGLAGTQMDGWLLMNGQNGTLDTRNIFPIAASAFTNGAWRTDADPNNLAAATGGQNYVTLTRSQLPELTFTLPTGAKGGGNFRFEFGDANNNGSVFTRTLPGTGSGRDGERDEDGNSPAEPHTNLPSFVALAMVVFNPLA